MDIVYLGDAPEDNAGEPTIPQESKPPQSVPATPTGINKRKKSTKAMNPFQQTSVQEKEKEPQMVSRSQIVCPSCGANTDSGGLFCTRCGFKFEPIRQETSTAKSVICPNCGMLNTGEGDFCTECGRSIAAAKAPPVRDICPVCNRKQPKLGKFCAFCGASMTADS